MKIDFKAAFSDVRRLVDSSASPERVAKGADDFSKSLASISPFNQQKAEIIKEKDSTQQLASVPREPMASYRPSSPALLGPMVETIQNSGVNEKLVNETPPTVKTPSFVGARRVRSGQGNLSRMPHAERVSMLSPLISETGRRYGIDPALGLAVVSAESSFDVNAVSRDGHASKGLFQLLDSTGMERMRILGLDREYDPFDPELNVELGVNYLHYLKNIFSTETALNNNHSTVPAANSASLEKLAVAAFNAGEGRVASAQARSARAGLDPSEYANVERYLPESTRTYVARVSDFKTRF